MSTSAAAPSPIYTLPPARIPVPGSFPASDSSESSPSPRPLSEDAPASDTRTPSSELRAYTPRAALYTPEAPRMATVRLRSLTPPAALATFLSTPSPARRVGAFTPSRAESGSRDRDHEGGVVPGHDVRVLGPDGAAEDGAVDYYELLGGGSDNDSVGSGRLSTVAEGLSDREDEEMHEDDSEDESAPAVSPQADHPTLQRGTSQVPEGDLVLGDDGGSDTSSVRSRLSTVAEGLSDEERDVEDYLMQPEDAHPMSS